MRLLKYLCSPSSVALIGVSRKTGTGALNPLQVLKDFGYKGRIYPVNPSADYILGHRCYKNITEVPEVPDLAVIMTSREIVPEILRECAYKNIKVAIVISDGFAESDEKGRLLQNQLKDIHRETGIRILGPNSMGVVNYYSSFTTSFVRLSSKVSPIAFLGQSGLFVQGFSFMRIGKSIDIGNGCDIGFAELLSELMDDDEIKIIVLHIEELDDPQSLSEVINKKGHKKPIIVFKSGRSEKAKKAIVSHSGSMAKDYNIYKAFFSALGFLTVESTQQLEDVVYMLSKIQIPEKRKVGIITPSGGSGIICLDAMEEHGFKLARLSEKSINRIRQIYPSYYSPSNPMDIMSASFRYGYKRVYTEALDSMIEDENVDIILCINGVPTLKTISSVIKEKKPKKTILSWVIGEYKVEEAEKLTENVPLPVFTHPERAFKALDMCIEYKRIKEISQKPAEFSHINKEKIERILKNASLRGDNYLFSEAFEIIKASALLVPPTVVLHDKLDFNKIKIRPPLCIKLDVKDVLHKRRAGLLKLGIMDTQQLIHAYNEIVSHIDKEKLRAVVVQEMVSEGIELFIGVKREPKFGSVMMIGKGGVDVEIYKDIETIMIPFNREQAIYGLKKTKIAKLLDKEKTNWLLDAMIKVSTLCTNFPVIKELDLNPLILNQDGIWAVDVKIII